MYTSFIDKVCEAVEMYGKGILLGNKFFNILNDIYSFYGDPKLRDTLKMCVQKGYVRTIAFFPVKKNNNIEDEIEKIYFAESYSNLKNGVEVVTVLFSVAIATQKTTLLNYKIFLNTHLLLKPSSSTSQQNPNPNPNPKPNPKPAPKNNLSSRSNPLPRSNPRQSGSNQFVIPKFWRNVVLGLVFLVGAAIVIIYLQHHGTDKSNAKMTPEERYRAREYQQKIERNKSLQASRDKVIELAFKGIQLGAPYNSALQIAKKSSELKDLKNGYYQLVIDGKKDPLNIKDNFQMQASGLSSNPSIVSGRWFSGASTLENTPIDVDYLEYKGKVAVIVVNIPNMYTSTYEDYSKLLGLYKEKYGDPERMTTSGLPYRKEKGAPDDYDIVWTSSAKMEMTGTIEDDDVWTFRNGSIRITYKAIIYLTKDFESTLLALNKKVINDIKQKEKAKLVAAAKEKERKEREQREAARRDSLQKVKKHKKAFTEI